MDPRLFGLVKIVTHTPYMAPAASEEEGDDFGDEEEEEEDEDEDEEDSEEEDDEDSEEEEEEDSEDEDEESEEEDEDSEEEDEEESEEEDKGKLSQRTQKRIKKLLGDNKDLKRQLEEAQKLQGDDGKAILSVAKKAGIFPRLMTKELAEKIEKYESKRDALVYIQEQLDDEEATEFEIGSKTYDRKELKREMRRLQEEVEDLEEDAKSAKSKAVKETKELIELGLAAKKAGWKPGEKGEKSKSKKSHKHEKPKSGKIRSDKKGKGRINFDEVDSDEDLEAMIMAQNRKKGRR